MLRVTLSLLLAASLGLGIGAWHYLGQDGQPAGPPTLVQVATAILSPLADQLDVPGTARASRTLTLLSEVDSRVIKLHFQEGQSVDAGDLLVSLDDRRAQEQLEQARAAYQLALTDYQSAARQVGERVLSQTGANDLKVVMEAARVGLEASRVALAAHRIRAPFDGIMGPRLVAPGADLSSGDAIATLDSVRNLEVVFQAPRRYLSALRPGLPVTAGSEVYPGKGFTGKVMLVDGRADGADGSLHVKALLNNDDALLRPGQPLRVSMHLQEHAAVLVPEQAIITQGAQSYVFTVSKMRRAERRTVSLGGRRADGWVEITAGLKDREPVIVKGHSHLGSGAPVRIIENQDAGPPDRPATRRAAV